MNGRTLPSWLAVLDRLKASPDVALAAGILGILFVILVPLPPAIVDLLLILNLTISAVILLTAACVTRPLEFSVFPSLLLVTTLFRLALNIATTRLILGNAAEGEDAAGHVVLAFGGFVAGDNPIVGMIVFGVIIVVQFVVITKGASRVSEVAARFRLDAMPGKQMSIDGDLASGLIDAMTARRRRDEVAQEADFYGAMDGASKFVRGDAVAGLVIVVINILGGISVAVVYHDMAVLEAIDVFSRLTIGDGLVSQVPALMVSIASALLVTRSAVSENLGRDFKKQIFANDQILFVVAGFLLLLSPTGLPVSALVAGAFVCAAFGFVLRRERRRDAESESGIEDVLEEIDAPDIESAIRSSSRRDPRALVKVEPITLEIGYRLLPLIDPDRGGKLLDRLAEVREAIALDLGLVVPAIEVRDRGVIAPCEYTIKLRGEPIGRWYADPDGLLATPRRRERALRELSAARRGPDLGGSPTFWLGESEDLPSSEHWEFSSPADAVARHLESVLRAHAAEILTREEVSRMLDSLREDAPGLVSDVVPNVVRVSDLQKILQGLLREGVSIRDLESILETLGNEREGLGDPEQCVENVRKALRRSICSRLLGSDGKLHVVALDPALEEFLSQSVERRDGAAVLHLDPRTAETIAERVEQAFTAPRRQTCRPVILASPRVRPFLRRIVEGHVPDVAILSYDEIADEGAIEAHGSISLEPSRRSSRSNTEVKTGR